MKAMPRVVAGTLGVFLLAGYCIAVSGDPSPPAHAGNGPVRYVNPGHANAADTGAGMADRPWKTLGYAMKQLKPGETLNIAAGTYREALTFPKVRWGEARTLIQSTGGRVMIKGSDVVSGWQSRGNGVFVKQPWTVNSQQVFVDGVPLKQIGGTILNGYPERADHPMKALHPRSGGIWPGRTPGGVGELTANSFHYEASSQSLYVKVPFASLEGHMVEVSVRTYVAFGQKLANVTLKNLHFQHSNTTATNYSGAVTLSGTGLIIDAIDIARTDGNGLDLAGANNVIRNSRASYCGQLGMKARGTNNHLTDNETNYNNTRGFNKNWEAGGAKFVGDGGLRDSEVARHRALGNAGDGIWFDWLNANNEIHHSVVAYNAGNGIHYEASQRGAIHDNYAFANGQRGIYLPHSAASIVAHNLVAANGMEGIVIIDEGRSPGMPQLRPRSNNVYGNIIAWNKKAAIVLPASLLDNASDYNLIVAGRAPPTFSIGWSAATNPLRVGLSEWRAASGQDRNAWVEVQEPPRDLVAAFQAKHDNADWQPVLTIAAKYRVPVPSEAAMLRASGAQDAPGPRG